MEVDKQTPHNKSHEDSLSDPDHAHPLPPKKRARDKPKRHKVELRTAEGSEEDQQQQQPQADPAMKAAHHNNHVADFGAAGAWPVDTKHDSAGAPVRADPAVRRDLAEGAARGEKKEGKKRPKEREKEEKKPPPLQPSSSDNNKASSEKAGEAECTTKRNLHLIRTERAGHRASDESHTAEDHEKKERRKRRKEKRPKRSREKDEGDGREGGGEKRRSSGEKEREGKQDNKRRKTKTRREVELESIHLSKQQEREKRAPKVERVALKPDNWHDVEREPLYNYMHPYENLPEDSAMKALKQNPNANNYTQRSDPPNGRSATEPTEKKAATERDKKEQCSTGPDCSEVSEKPSIKTDLIKFIKNPPCLLWIIVLLLFMLCLGLGVAVYVLQAIVDKQAEELNRPREKN